MPSSTSRERRRPSAGRIREERISYRLGRLYEKRLRILVLPAFLFLVVLAGGGMPLWAQALVLIVGGLVGLVHPPFSSPGRGFDWAAVAVFAAACLAFLPGSILGHASWWSGAEQLGIALPDTVTPGPRLVGQGLLLLLGGLLWFYLIWQWKPQAEHCRRVLYFFAAGVAVLGICVALGTYYGYTYPLARGARVFTFFENRNQMATVLAMGGVVAFSLAMQAMRKGSVKGIWSLLYVLAIIVGLAFCQSRAGVLLFGLGCVLWIVVRLRVSRVNLMFKLGAPLFLLCLALLFLFGQSTLERFQLWDTDKPGQMAEMRVGIYQDATKMALAQPVAGVGLGNFAGVFPQYKDKTTVFQSIIHPESDWMWWWTETGFVGLAALVVALVLLVLRLFPFGEDRTAPFRAAAAIALVIFLLHSLIDVPGHRLGTFLIAAMLYRVAARPRSNHHTPLLGRWGGRLVALVCLAGGGYWLVGNVLDLPWHSRIAQAQARASATDERSRDAQGIIGALDRAIAFNPLNWWNYSVRGSTKLRLMRDESGALADFRRARFLEKTTSEVSFYEGQIWLNYNTRNAMAAWRDALNREDPNRDDLFRKMLESSLPYPRFKPELSQLTRFDDDFRYKFLMSREPAEFRQEIETDVLVDPQLANFSEPQRAALLERWAEVSAPGVFLQYLEAHPDLVANAWYFRSIAAAAQGDYEQAVEAMGQHLSAPYTEIPGQYREAALAENLRTYSSTPSDFVRGLVLVEGQIEAEDYSGALRTAEAMTRQDKVPPAAYYWQGEALRQLGRYPEAWEAWRLYRRKVPALHLRTSGQPEATNQPTPNP